MHYISFFTTSGNSIKTEMEDDISPISLTIQTASLLTANRSSTYIHHFLDIWSLKTFSTFFKI